MDPRVIVTSFCFRKNDVSRRKNDVSRRKNDISRRKNDVSRRKNDVSVEVPCFSSSPTGTAAQGTGIIPLLRVQYQQ